MIVSCPTCGQRVPIHDWEFGMRVICLCKSRYVAVRELARAESVHGAPDHIVAARRDVCRECPKFNDDRCSHIDLGCKRTFIIEIEKLSGACPLGKWGEIPE